MILGGIKLFASLLETERTPINIIVNSYDKVTLHKLVIVGKVCLLKRIK